MDFAFEPIRVRGRAAHPTTVEFVRELIPEDVLLIRADNNPKTKVVSKLRERHHALARCLALGMRDYEASIATGYDAARIALLKTDPAMAELIVFYRGDVTAEMIERADVWKGISLDALNELRDRMEEDPDSMSDAFLLKLAESGSDRTGLGPSTTQNSNVNVTVNMAERMEKARQRRLQIEAVAVSDSGRVGNPIPAAAPSSFPAVPAKITDIGE